MTHLFVLANRCLYALVAAALAAMVAAPVAGWLEGKAEVVALPVPQVTVPELAEHEPPSYPTRNIFDPDGKPWKTEDPVAAAVKPPPPPPTVVPRGVMILPGLSGVFTDKGFVQVGHPLLDGDLKEVTPDGYVLSTPTGERTEMLNPERLTRIKTLTAPPPPKKPVQAGSTP